MSMASRSLHSSVIPCCALPFPQSTACYRLTDMSMVSRSLHSSVIHCCVTGASPSGVKASCQPCTPTCMINTRRKSEKEAHR